MACATNPRISVRTCRTDRPTNLESIKSHVLLFASRKLRCEPMGAERESQQTAIFSRPSPCGAGASVARRAEEYVRTFPASRRIAVPRHDSSAEDGQLPAWRGRCRPHPAGGYRDVTLTSTCSDGDAVRGPMKVPATGGTASGRRASATGMWSLPVSLPMVGSNPFHPAPGR
jgi:hypothetical protein